LFLEVKDMPGVVEAINGKLHHTILIPGEHLRIAWKTWLACCSLEHDNLGAPPQTPGLLRLVL
jgi:hypothetical protein